MTYDYGGCFEYKYSKANKAGVLRTINNAILLSELHTFFSDTVFVVLLAMFRQPTMTLVT
jgi:hypothetical protein